MTKKERNLEKRKLWNLIMSTNSEVSQCVKKYGSAFVYDLIDGDKKRLVVVGNPRNIHDNFLNNLGFNPSTTNVKFFMLVTSNHDIKYWNERR